MSFLYGTRGQEEKSTDQEMVLVTPIISWRNVEEQWSGWTPDWSRIDATQGKHTHCTHKQRTHGTVCLLVVYVTTMVGVHKGLDDLKAYPLLSSVYKYTMDKYRAVTFTLITIERIEDRGGISFVWWPVCYYFSNSDDVTDVSSSHGSVCDT